MATWLVVSELAQRLGRSEATVLNWQRWHPAHVERRVNEQGVIVLPLEPLQKIRAMYDDGMQTRQVRTELARRRSGEPAPVDPLLAVLREIRDDLRAIRRAVERNAGADDGPTES